MNAIADLKGFEVEYKNTAWDGIFAGLESGTMTPSSRRCHHRRAFGGLCLF
jgi:hypothetical protein